MGCGCAERAAKLRRFVAPLAGPIGRIGRTPIGAVYRSAAGATKRIPNLTFFTVYFQTTPVRHGKTTFTAINFDKNSAEIGSGLVATVSLDLDSTICGINAQLTIPGSEHENQGDCAGYPDAYWTSDTVFEGYFSNYSFPDAPVAGDTESSLLFADCAISYQGCT